MYLTLAKFFLNMDSSYGEYRDSAPGQARFKWQLIQVLVIRSVYAL